MQSHVMPRIKLHLLEGISEPEENSVNKKIHIIFLEGFMVDLETFFGLAMPN